MSKNNSNEDDALLMKLDLITKLLYIQTKRQLKETENEFIKTDKQKMLYSALDGKQSMEDLHKITKISVKTMEPLLPEWEKQGLILSFGKGKNKRYVNLENLVI